MKVRAFFRYVTLLGAASLAPGCSSLQPADFQKSRTHFELDRYFVGHARSWGVFENRDGNPRRTFVCDSYGRRDKEGVVILHQDFKFSDGKTQTRDWRIWRTGPAHWQATANDMVGTASAEGMGNALYWEYTITVDAKNPLASVRIRQWIYQVEGTDSLLTRLHITKLGVTLFEVTESIHHVPDATWPREK